MRRPLASFAPFLCAFFLLVLSGVQALANPTVPQGGSASFLKSGTDHTVTPYAWEIWRAGSMVCNASSPASWTVSYVSGTTTFTVGAPSSATIAVNYEVKYNAGGGSYFSAFFDVISPVMSVTNLTVSPVSLIGGQTATGTVTLSLTAPTGGQVVTLSSNSSAATVPASITVAAGASTANFSISTTTVAASTAATITATTNGSSKTATVTVLPQPVLTSLGLSAASVTGGLSPTGTVTLQGVAPAGGVSVALSSSVTAAATVPATVIVQPGQTSATFAVTTFPQTADTSLTITGVYNGVTKTAPLTVLAPVLTSFTVSPNPVYGGQSVTLNVGLSGAAAVNTYVTVTVSDSRAVANFPLQVTVPAGLSSVGQTVPVSTTNFVATVSFTATLGLASINANLTINPQYITADQVVMPGTIHLTWSSSAAGSFLLYRSVVQLVNGVYQIGTRTLLATCANTVKAYSDASGFTTGTIYYYELDDSTGNVNLAGEMLTPQIDYATDSQTVDSRWDPRTSTFTHTDYLFGTSTYRGGLFVGYASDNSQVSRSVAKFTAAAPSVSGSVYRTASINAYNTAWYVNNGTVSQTVVGCQLLSGGSWSGPLMNWDNAPWPTGFSAASATVTATVPASRTSPVAAWYSWPECQGLETAIGSRTPVTAVWASTGETGSGWSYFAKHNFNGGATAPAMTTLWDLPVPVQIALNPTSVHTGGYLNPAQVACSLWINGVGLGDSVPVAVTVTASNGSSFMGLPGQSQSATYYTFSDTVTGLARSFSFSVFSAPSGSGPWTVTVSATANGITAQAVETVSN